ncbi:MAG: diguanylate cyclase [Firmicutes bacterium]|nr:diguanylate cyclase [Bacillota bacterium]
MRWEPDKAKEGRHWRPKTNSWRRMRLGMALGRLLFDPENPTAIWCTDVAHRIVKANAAASFLLTGTYSNIDGSVVGEFFGRDGFSPEVMDATVISSGKPDYHAVEHWNLADRRTLDVEVDRIPLREGNRVVALAVMVRPVASWSEQRYRTILEEIKDGYFEVDLAGNLTFFNPALVEILGYPEDELYGLNDREYTDPQNAKALYERFNQVYRTGNPFSAEWEIIRKDGAHRYLDATVSLMRDGVGNPVGFRGIARDITPRKTMELQLHHLAHHDILTNLPNRFLVMDGLSRALSEASTSGVMVAVLFVDLDRFKYINDTLGHSAGDQLLQNVAKRLQAGLRSPDVVARMGGDEFIVVLPRVTSVEEILQIAQRMILRLQQPWSISGKVFFCPASIGIAIYPDDGASPESLLKHADIAMYRAKAKGGNSYALYRSPE